VIAITQKTTLLCALTLPIGPIRTTFTQASDTQGKDLYGPLRFDTQSASGGAHESLPVNRYHSFSDSDFKFGDESMGKLSLLAQIALGANSVQRLSRFTRSQVGWHFGEGESMSDASLQSADKFLRQFGANLLQAIGHPSVFLNTKGEVELIWKTETAGLLELDFRDDQTVEYCFERKNVESAGSRADVYRALVTAIQ